MRIACEQSFKAKKGPRIIKQTQISYLVDSRTYSNEENYELLTEKIPKNKRTQNNESETK